VPKPQIVALGVQYRLTSFSDISLLKAVPTRFQPLFSLMLDAFWLPTNLM
jgi:hypothetical protein